MSNLYQYYKDNPKQREKDYLKYLEGKKPKLKLNIKGIRYAREGIGCEFNWMYVVCNPFEVWKDLRKIYLFNGTYDGYEG